MKPLFARVLLKRKPATTSRGGIILPDDAQKRYASLRCTVVALGDNCELKGTLEPGDEVLIGIHAGTWINANGDPVFKPEDAEFFIAQEEDLLVVFPREEPKEQPSDRAEPTRDYLERAVRSHRAA